MFSVSFLTLTVQRENLETLASRLASTLGVGRLSNVHEHCLERLMAAAFDYAFSTDKIDEDCPGSHLGILSLISK